MMNHVPATDGSKEVADDPVLVVREVTVLYVWPQIVEPPQSAALAAPLETCDAICSDNHDTLLPQIIAVASRASE
jgi:hypothetical protein